LIVVDTNLVAALLLDTEATPTAERIHLRDPEWAVPPLWRSELRSVLVQQVRARALTLAAAESGMELAVELLASLQQDVMSQQVLRLAVASGCSAYDCEFVALAQLLEVDLVTFDRALLRQFPETAVSPEEFAAG